jgi:anti-sigma factor RsiW
MAANHPDTALVPFIRGELAALERERVAGHLEGCLQCRQEAESLHSLLTELSARIDELPTPDWTVYRAQLRRKLAARTQPRARWWSGSFGWASLAAAAATAAIALWFAVPRFHSMAPSPVASSDDQIALVQQLDVTDVGLLRNYGVVERLDLLENYDVIEHLDELKPVSQPGNAVRS